MSVRKFRLLAATAAVATFAALGATAAHAHGGAVDVQWSVTIGSPVVTLPAPRVLPPVVVATPAPVAPPGP